MKLLPLFLLLPALLSGQVMIDTVGLTTRDRQMYGPAVRYLVNDTLRGVHVVWKDGYSDIRYNFRRHDSTWRWPGGTVINPYPRNLGCLDVDLFTGVALISTDYLERGVAQTAYYTDTLPGSAGFVERATGAGFRHNLVTTTNYGWFKFLAERDDTLFFRAPWSERRLELVGPFPAYNLAGSKRTSRYGCIWTANAGPDSSELFLQETPNNGQSWYPVIALSDSLRSRTRLNRSLLGASACYDSIRLYLVADCYDGSDPNHSQLWLYAKYDSPPWHPVHEQVIPGSVDIGGYALAAGRPTIGFNPRNGDLLAAWEQFDPANIEPITGLARADIWAARSTDRGRTWGTPVRLTEPDQASKRFPVLAEFVLDTLKVLYFEDLVAGFWEQGQGPVTENPVILLQIPASNLPTSAVAEPPAGQAGNGCRLFPTASRTGFTLTVPAASDVRVVDAAGRCRRRLSVPAGRFRCPAEAEPGLYFVLARPRGTTGPGLALRFLRLP